MKRIPVLILFYLLAGSCIYAHDYQQITNIPGRQTFSLNGRWNTIVDPFENGYYDYRYVPFDQMEHDYPRYGGFYLDLDTISRSELLEYTFNNTPTLVVPGDWNTQSDKLFYYEGTIWYRKKFDYKKTDPDNRIYVHFGASNYTTDVYLNGKKLGKHVGGFTPFNYEITHLLKGQGNSLVVKVDNKRSVEDIPTLNYDWWNYGGITRDVNIVEVPSTFIQDYKIQINNKNNKLISGFIRFNGSNIPRRAKIEIPEMGISTVIQTNNQVLIPFNIPIENITYWSPQNPKLYDVRISTTQEEINDKIGFRTLETRGHEILLNGEPIFLRGICIHEENPVSDGRAYSVEDAKTLLTWAKELNANFVRLAHYPHNEHMIRMADELGLMVWSEIPVYWTIEWENPQTLANATHQLSQMIIRDQNRASIIIWSMANETPVSDARNSFLKHLADTARSLDNTRFISAAMEKTTSPDDSLTLIVKDPFAEYVDIVSFNQYLGWYDGLPEKCNRVTWQIDYDKPVVISEFGGGALAGFHGDSITRWSEEFLEDLYIQNLKMIENIPEVSGTTPWLLADFRSPRRLLWGIQDGFNRKGLISETGHKKKAFWVLKSFYDKKELEYNADE